MIVPLTEGVNPGEEQIFRRKVIQGRALPIKRKE